ncbi:MAG: DNA mismatch repair endonuclease MutL [Thermodesulfobacteriota bacterium]|nr:DNA mismatch repair endonuclease MutL [Thermodesulfobacteriota bacterium]
MPHIKILPEILSNKIAAGEVVERPASVVKELIENSLDAESKKIIIEVENGGRFMIRVSDNGVGMNHDDALLSVERYATSKIFTDRDLFSINTLGFRGEALPSIASVAKFSLVARDKFSEVGTQIHVDGGRVKKVEQIGAPVGSLITVKQLFYNTPARRKFLKTVNTEMGHIADTVAAAALYRSDVHFTLYHNAKMVKNWLPTSDPVDRAADVLGKDIRAHLYPLNYKGGNLGIDGWIVSPTVTRRTFKGVYIYVNGRVVRDRVVRHALLEGYAQRLMKSTFPVAVLFINVPFDQVDVNVHPTKNEVRFVRQKEVHDLVKRAVGETLQQADRPTWGPRKSIEDRRTIEQSQVAEESIGYRSIGRSASLDEEGAIRFNQQPVPRNSQHETRTPYPETRIPQPATQTPLWGEKRFSDLRVIGQLHHTYILCESKDTLFLIDQHAAHERIVFEQLKKRSKGLKTASQRLLIPETIDMGYLEAEMLTGLIPEFEKFGLEMEHFGGNTFVVKSVPGILSGKPVKPLIMEMVEKMIQTGFSPGLEKAMDELMISMACHSAIRANQPLTDAQIKGLLDQLDHCENPSHCPHGRPTWIQWTLKDLEKSFGRIV